MWSCDRDTEGNPELIVKIPRNTYDISMMLGSLIVKCIIIYTGNHPRLITYNIIIVTV